MTKTIRWVVALAIPLLLAGCYMRVRTAQVRELTARGTPVTSPIKAHMRDGSVVVFAQGAYVGGDSVHGVGERFSAAHVSMGRIVKVPLDSVLGLVNFRNGTALSETIVLSMLGTAAGAIGAAGLAVAIFGSCPTFYTDSGGVAKLQAEGFSYSIAPLFESRDVDALRGAPRHGVFTVEVRNEALETHYINHLELLHFQHPRGARVLPDGRGQLTGFGRTHAPTRARDRSGRDVRDLLADADERVFASSDARMQRIQAADLVDYIDLEFPAVATDTVAVTLRLRNSLLTTVLLYDVMLASAGARALDWVALDLEEVRNAAALSKWYVERMGLRVLVLQAGRYVEVGRIPDVGPIAWKDVALLVPARSGAPVQMRVEFPADSWRIEQIALGESARRVQPRAIPVARIRHADGSLDQRGRDAVMSNDEAYLVTEPGRRVFAEFDVPATRAGLEDTYLLASQGYYYEWIRPDWVRRGAQSPFKPTDASLYRAMQQWRGQKQSLEQTFYATKIPVQ
jgi:hypothetical protein